LLFPSLTLSGGTAFNPEARRAPPATARSACPSLQQDQRQRHAGHHGSGQRPRRQRLGQLPGLSYDSLINGQLGLPGTANASLLVQIRNAANQPVLP
jgi:hypothetical protein